MKVIGINDPVHKLPVEVKQGDILIQGVVESVGVFGDRFYFDIVSGGTPQTRLYAMRDEKVTVLAHVSKEVFDIMTAVARAS